MALTVAQKLHAEGISLKAQFGAYPLQIINTAVTLPGKRTKKGMGWVETVYSNYENVRSILGIGEMGRQALQAISDFLKKNYEFNCRFLTASIATHSTPHRYPYICEIKDTRPQ